ncbi:MAG: ADOP family duplicated permease [Blastocatellales bacterium]
MPEWKQEIRRRLANLHLSPTRESAIVEELAQHLDDCYAELLCGGATEDEAYRAALAELSESELLARELRRVERQVSQEPIVLGTNRRTNMIADFWQDLRFGARMLLKKPSLTLITVLTLALGIGANTALFSVINAVLLSPLPFPEAGRLMAVGENSPENRTGLSTTSYRNFADWRAQNHVFEDMAAYRGGAFTLTGQGEAAQLRGTVVTHNLFQALRATPLLGRAFLPDDEKPGGGNAGRPAILSWDCWQQYFGGDPQVVGRALRLNGDAYVVVGVMPAQFAFPIEAEPTQIWTSTARDAEKTGEGSIMVARGYRGWRVVTRLKDGVSSAQAQADLNVIASNLAAQYPEANRDRGVTVAPLLDSLVSNVRSTLWLLLGAVGCVLLIACFNVANLLLERAILRRREISLRLALGASRWRLTRQLLTESVMLAALGGLVGLLFARWGQALLVAFSPEGIARINEARLDLRVLAFTLLVSLFTGVLFGLAPALAASGVSLGEALKEGGRGASGGRRLSGARSLLVVFEIAIALALLVGGSLLLRSLAHLQRTGLGFNTENVLTFGLAVSDEALGGKQVSPQQRADFYRQVEERLKSLPGVTGASVTSALPLSGGASYTGLTIEGRAIEPGREPMGLIHSVGVDYFRLLGIPLIKGHVFTPRDELNAAPVLLVNETLAKRLFPNEDALGKRIEPNFSAAGPTRMREIVGIVGDTRHTGPRDEPVPEIYFAQAQMPMEAMTVVVRTTADPRGLANAARDTVRSLNQNVPVYRFRTLDEYFARNLAAARFNTLLMGLFAVVALMITLVGLYGVISCAVSQSTQELGIRMALGGQASDILRLVLKQGLALVLLGVALGIGGAFALTRLMADLLYNVGATDPLTFVAIPALLILVALLACYLPARRATKVDPLVALRSE